MKTPPIKCTPCLVYVESMSTRFHVHSNGSVQICGQETVYEPEDRISKVVRREASRLRRNRNARERNQAMKDLGLTKTPFGWE